MDVAKTIYLHRFSNFFQHQKRLPNQKRIVCMIDGRIHHGGLSDRLCGIVSCYAYCRENNINFKLFYCYPYKLDKFLQPNEYDWRINEDQIYFNPFKTHIVYISLFDKDLRTMRRYANCRLDTNKQESLVYTNMYYFRDAQEFSFYFNELFRPSLVLRKEIKRNRSLIKGNYVSLTFRFQQLLGDFKETGFKILKTEEEKEALISKCLSMISDLYAKERCTILVTSESKTFLNRANAIFDFVYVIPGDIVHIDFVDKEEVINNISQLKSFVDLYMIANANKIYLATIPPLYRSSFPLISSWIYQKPCYEIFYDDDEIKFKRRYK